MKTLGLLLILFVGVSCEKPKPIEPPKEPLHLFYYKYVIKTTTAPRNSPWKFYDEIVEEGHLLTEEEGLKKWQTDSIPKLIDVDTTSRKMSYDAGTLIPSYYTIQTYKQCIQSFKIY